MLAPNPLIRLGEARGDMPGDMPGDMVRGVEGGDDTALRSLEVMWSDDDDTELSALSVFPCRVIVNGLSC